MDIKTISATLALLAGGVALQACDDAEKKPATEVEGAKKNEAKSASDKAKAGEDKANAKAEKEDKGEMACGEGACGDGACGGHKGDKDDKKAVHADGDEGDEAKGEDAEGQKAEGEDAEAGEAEGEDEDKT